MHIHCAWLCTWLYHAHTLYIHVHTSYIHVHTLYIGIKYFTLEPLRYFPLLFCLYSLHEVLYYASVQESAFLYMQGSYRSVLPKNGSGRWSAFLWHLPFSCTDVTVHGESMYRRWHTRMYAFLKKCFWTRFWRNPACTERLIPVQ